MTTREQAMQWWGNLTDQEKYSLGNSTAELRNYNGITWQNFTGREIEEIWRKEVKTKNIYLNRLKEQYTKSKEREKRSFQISTMYDTVYYDAMRLFCLDTQLVSFNDIEANGI